MNDASRESAAHVAIMQAACASAIAGVTLKHGGPFGACVVRDGIFISMSHNTVLHDCDPTCHAEMNAIRYACAAINSHDLSDCELYTTCEPCPMCWGAIQWSRVKKVYTGVDRFTAAQFGFDDKVFYDELSAQSGHWAVKLGSTMPNVQPSMLNVYYGIEKLTVRKILGDLKVNKTFRRRLGEKSIGFHDDGERFGEDLLTSGGARKTSTDYDEAPDSEEESKFHDNEDTARYMGVLEDAVKKAVHKGKNKEREVFASCIVKDGKIISVAVNEVLRRHDATATSEVLAIRKASKELGTYILAGCSLYSTVEPDVMSLGAILWARIDNLYFGLSQNAAARYGFEEGLMHYRELFADAEVVKKVMNVQTKVASEHCENVFREWTEVNAILY